MKEKLKIIAVFLVLLCISGCGVHIEKRKHRKGFHLSWNKNYNVTTKGNSEIEIEKVSFHSIRDSNFETVQKTEIVAETTTVESTSKNVKEESVHSANNKDSNIKNAEAKTVQVKNGSGEKITKSKLIKSKRTKHSGYLYLLTLLTIPFITLNKKRNYRLASWASKHKRKAQWGIGLGTTLAFLSSYFIGRLWNFEVPYFGLEFSLLLGSIGSIIYILSKSLTFKAIGSMVIGSGAYFGAFALGTMRSDFHLISDPQLHGLVVALLTILLVAALLGSLYGIAILSCELSCNGYGFLAGALLIGGSYLVSFLFMVGIFNIWRPDMRADGLIAKKAALWALVVMGGIALLVIGIPLLFSL